LPAEAQSQPKSTPESVTHATSTGTNPLPAGQVLDPVASAADATETYALYLPSAYTSDKQWPIVYAFDPAARGGIPVKLYKDAAEKYGYILAASNNSRNFQSDEVSRAATAMWRDTHARLALDPRRIYTMGFSGGARVATELAMRCEQCAVAGVIAHGAGYPSPSPPQPNERFAYFSFVGDQDFNWPEIMQLRQKKEAMDAAYRLRVFPGEHDWAPAEIFAESIEWLQLKAMQAGIIPHDVAFLDRQFARTRKQAEEAAQRKDAVAEFDAYRSLAFDFKGLRDIAQYETKLAAFKSSVELKQALKKQQYDIDRQNALMQPLSSSLAQLAEADLQARVSLRSTITDGMRDLSHKADRAKNDAERVVLLRAFNGLWIQVLEAGEAALQNDKRLATAELYFQLLSDLTPEQPWPHLLLAETAATRGDRKHSVKELREAVKHGLKNPASLEKAPRLQSLRDDAEYQEIVSELKARRDAQGPQ
jgi:dienelactone hydrolase